jgi:hypothetical protein
MFARARMTGAVGVVALSAILYGGFIAARLAYHGWDPSFFIVAGDAFCQPQLVPGGLTVNEGDGYDGQFYYRLALDPFTKAEFEYGIAFDDAPYRQQRILYPLLAGILVFGQTSFIPWSMLLVNYFALCLLAFSAARLAELFDLPAAYGLVVAFYPGILLALDRDLTDVLSVSIIVTSLFLFHSHRNVLAAVLLALALLTRETVVLLASVLFVDSLWRAVHGRPLWKTVMPWTIPLATWTTWQLWLYATWGVVAARRRTTNNSYTAISKGLPFSGLIPTLSHALRLAATVQLQLLGELSLISLIAVLAAIQIFRSSAYSGVKLAWLAYLFLVLLLSQNIWVEDWAFLRATADLMMLSLIIMFGARKRRPITIVVVPTLAIWLVLAGQTVTTQ